MDRRSSLQASYFYLIFALLLATGCGLQALEVGPTETHHQTVELGQAESVEAEISLGTGRLEIGPGASGLLAATFTHNVVEWEPVIDYEVVEGQGKLTVRQPAVEGKIPVDLGQIRYDWDLRFDEETPLALAIVMGAGEGLLDLGHLNLEKLVYQGGAGDVEIDLRGTKAAELDIRLGAGNVWLDLSGPRKQDLSVKLDGGIGAVTVILPAEEAVRVEIGEGVGQVEAPGLKRAGFIYTNEAYDPNGVTLDLVIKQGLGNIELRTAE
jgi:hypothetical protein